MADHDRFASGPAAPASGRRRRWGAPILGLLLAAALALAPTAAAAGSMAPACDGVNLRTSASTSATVKVRLGLANTVTVGATVAGGSWSTICPTSKAGSTWFQVTQVNGTSVTTLYGVTYLFAATGVLAVTTPSAPAPDATASPSPTPAVAPVETPQPATTPVPTAAPTAPPTAAPTAAPIAAPTAAPTAVVGSGQSMVPACDGANLRTSASTSGTLKVRLGINGNSVVVSGTVSGGSWSTICPTAKSGSSWYRVTSINGASVATLYGVSALYAASGVLSSGVTATTPGVTILGASTTFFGRGYGHGVGLSQYGARGRALAGQSATEILAQYFAGTTVGTIAAGQAIRVLVLDDFTASAAAPLLIYGRGGDWEIAGIGTSFPADARLRMIPTTSGTTTTWRAIVDTTAGAVLYSGPVPSDSRIRSKVAGGSIQLYSKPSTYDRYRGTLRVLATGARVDVINELDLETYLRGVVPAEMPSTWPAEARAAQTIVARSYAAVRLRPATGTFDVYDDTRSQVYGGMMRETLAADATVLATANQVVKAGAAVANTYFHSTGGGATENNEYVFNASSGAVTSTPLAYLRGSPDRDPAGVPYDAGAPFATWQTKAYSVAALSAIFGADARTSVGTLVGFDFRNRGVSGRLISVTVIGSTATKTVSGNVFIAVFNARRPLADPPLRSTLLAVTPIP